MKPILTAEMYRIGKGIVMGFTRSLVGAIVLLSALQPLRVTAADTRLGPPEHGVDSANVRLLATGEHDIDVGDVRLHYVVRGQGPLLFVTFPGWGVTSTPYQIGLAPLEKTLTMVYIDTRGSGGSTRPADRSRMSQYAQQAQAEAQSKAARDQSRDLPSIRARTLILNGTVDFVCPYGVAQRLHTAIPHSELHLYANKGHMLWIEDRPRFFADVLRFMN